jgi:predicted dinucleotide-utilizing enzyme
MSFPEIIEWAMKLGLGAIAMKAVDTALGIRAKRAADDTTLTLADKNEVSRINKSTQERLERQVDKLLEEFMEVKEAASQLAIAKAILEFKVEQLTKENAHLEEHAAQLQSRLNGGTNGGDRSSG